MGAVTDNLFIFLEPVDESRPTYANLCRVAVETAMAALNHTYLFICQHQYIFVTRALREYIPPSRHVIISNE